MALKKTKRPTLFQHTTENESVENDTWNNVMLPDNGLAESNNTPHAETHFKEYEEESESVIAKSESPIDRLISFMEGNVRVPRKARVEEGDYFFRIENITSREDIEGKYGAYDQFLISFTLFKNGTDSPVQITIPYTVSSNPESPLIKFLSNFRPIFEGQRITIRQLVGLIGRCRISHYETESGDVFERLEVRRVEHPHQ